MVFKSTFTLLNMPSIYTFTDSVYHILPINTLKFIYNHMRILGRFQRVHGVLAMRKEGGVLACAPYHVLRLGAAPEVIDQSVPWPRAPVSPLAHWTQPLRDLRLCGLHLLSFHHLCSHVTHKIKQAMQP
jgi:hypothetical protein